MERLPGWFLSAQVSLVAVLNAARPEWEALNASNERFGLYFGVNWGEIL